MTPKEKAIFLMARFEIITHPTIDCDKQFAKQCALIVIDEILKSNPIIPLEFMLESEALDAANEYWQQVKQEIEKL